MRPYLYTMILVIALLLLVILQACAFGSGGAWMIGIGQITYRQDSQGELQPAEISTRPIEIPNVVIEKVIDQ